MPWKFRAFALGALLAVSLPATTACGRFKPARSYQVSTSNAPAAYAIALEVLKSEHYVAVERRDHDMRVKVVAHVDERSNNRSFITLQVSGDTVELVPTGYLVHQDGTIHHALAHELALLEIKLKGSLSGDESAPATSAAASHTSDLPAAWTEPASDAAKWGPGNFTCLPISLPRDEQGALKLRLSNGEGADVALSIAYARELCRSPDQCKLADGCPALGIGDSEQVKKLALRIFRAEVDDQAVLLHHGKPAVRIDLAHHGSIAQSLSELNH